MKNSNYSFDTTGGKLFSKFISFCSKIGLTITKAECSPSKFTVYFNSVNPIIFSEHFTDFEVFGGLTKATLTAEDIYHNVKMPLLDDELKTPIRTKSPEGIKIGKAKSMVESFRRNCREIKDNPFTGRKDFEALFSVHLETLFILQLPPEINPVYEDLLINTLREFRGF